MKEEAQYPSDPFFRFAGGFPHEFRNDEEFSFPKCADGMLEFPILRNGKTYHGGPPRTEGPDRVIFRPDDPESGLADGVYCGVVTHDVRPISPWSFFHTGLELKRLTFSAGAECAAWKIHWMRIAAQEIVGDAPCLLPSSGAQVGSQATGPKRHVEQCIGPTPAFANSGTVATVPLVPTVQTGLFGCTIPTQPCCRYRRDRTMVL